MFPPEGGVPVAVPFCPEDAGRLRDTRISEKPGPSCAGALAAPPEGAGGVVPEEAPTPAAAPWSLTEEVRPELRLSERPG